MNALPFAKFGILVSLLAGPVFATPELEFLRQRCEAQETRIRELEAKLGIARTPQPVVANVEEAKPAPTPQPAQATPPPSAAEYEVKPGDSLERIARKHDCRVPALLALNNLKPDSIIRPGQKLQLPTKQDPPAPMPTALKENTRPLETATHQVASGETFAAIARQHGIPLSELLSANPDVKPTALRTGQIIHLGKTNTPAKQAVLATQESTTILATHQATEPAIQKAAPKPVKIQPVLIDREMTYQEFAQNQGTTTSRLNELNGLDLTEGALLAKGSELLAPTIHY